MRQDSYALQATVTEDHIRHARWASWHKPDDDRADAIVTAIRDAGVSDVKMETYSNLIPPNHNWAIWLNGVRYAMSHTLRRYYSYFIIEGGSRTDPAVIHFSDVSHTADVRILPPDNRPAWEKAGMSYSAWREQQIGGESRAVDTVVETTAYIPEVAASETHQGSLGKGITQQGRGCIYSPVLQPTGDIQRCKHKRMRSMKSLGCL